MLSISVHTRQPGTLLSLAGECDITTAPQLVAALTSIPASCRLLVIDLSGTTFMDVATVHVLLDAHHRFAAHGTHLIVAAAQPVVSRVLELTTASQVIHVTARPPSAIFLG